MNRSTDELDINGNRRYKGRSSEIPLCIKCDKNAAFEVTPVGKIMRLLCSYHMITRDDKLPTDQVTPIDTSTLLKFRKK